MPIGEAAKPHTFSTLFTTSHFLSALLNSLHLFLTLLNSLFISLPSSQLFSARLASSHLCSTRPIFSQPGWSVANQTFTQRSFYTKQTLTQRNLYRENLFCIENLLRRESFTQRNFYTEKALDRARFYTETFTQSSFYTETLTQSKLLHTEAFAWRNFYTHNLLHRETFTQRSFYSYTDAEKFVHRKTFTRRICYTTKSFTQSQLLHKKKLHTEALTQRNCYTEQTLHKARFYTEKLSHKDSFSTSTPKRKNDDFEALSKRNFKAKSSAPKWRRICCQSTIRNLYAATTIRFIRLPATKDTGILRTQPQQRGTLAHPFPLRSEDTRLQDATELCTTATQIAAPKPHLDAKADSKIISAKVWRKNMLPKHHSQLSCSHYFTIYDIQLEKNTSISRTAAEAARNLNTSIPLRSADTRLQSRKAEHQQRKRKVTWDPQLHCARKSNRNRRQRFKWHPRCSSSNAICQNWLTIATHYSRTRTFRETLTQPFHCDLHGPTCKTQYSVNKEEKVTSRNRRQSGDPKPSRKRANFSPQRNLRLPEKNTMFRQSVSCKS